MCPNSVNLTCRKWPRRQSGSALVLAIFILVVMLLLGATLTKTLNKGADAIAYEVLGTRAFQAANIGVQARLAQVFPLNNNTLHCDGTDITTTANGYDSADNTIPVALANLNGVQGLNNCNVTAISCSDFKEDGVVYFNVEATGQCSIDGSVTSRTVEVEARSL